jgi:hypothetical protein
MLDKEITEEIKKNKYEFIPVNKSILVKPISEDNYKRAIGEFVEETLTSINNKKIGNMYIPMDVTPKDKGVYIIYAKGIVEKINDTEEIPFKVNIGDIVVYNIDGVLKYNQLGEPELSKVAYSDIIVLLKKQL